MNYLAHLYLADPKPDAWVGNLMGDFVKGPLDDSLKPVWRQGIVLHRAVDHYTDQHPVFLRSKHRISPPYRRYAGILIDMFYDHLLAVSWPQYSEQNLRLFTRAVYAALRQRYAQLPPRMQKSVSYMLMNDLLLSYRQTEGIARALRGIEGRLRRPSGLGNAITQLDTHYDQLHDDFQLFFPELIDHVKALKAQELV